MPLLLVKSGEMGRERKTRGPVLQEASTMSTPPCWKTVGTEHIILQPLTCLLNDQCYILRNRSTQNSCKTEATCINAHVAYIEVHEIKRGIYQTECVLFFILPIFCQMIKHLGTCYILKLLKFYFWFICTPLLLKINEDVYTYVVHWLTTGSRWS